MPQVPQFKTSRWVSTQNGPHALVPGGQVTPQVPARHASPGGQAMPHAPQLASSCRGSTQPVPHERSGIAHALLQAPSTQTPARQSVFRAQPPPSAHGPHALPPQSTPVSSPFFRPSVQLAATQSPASQLPL